MKTIRYVVCNDKASRLVLVPERNLAMRDFSKSTLAALAVKGISIIGTCVIPAVGDMPFANGSRGYRLNDNGCGKIRSFAEVLELAQ